MATISIVPLEIITFMLWRVTNMNRIERWIRENDWKQIGIVSYYGYFAINVLAKAFAYDSGDNIYNFFMLAGVFFLGIKLATTKYTLREIFWICIFSGIGLVLMIITKKATLLLLFLTIVGMKDCRFQNLLKISVWIRVFVTFVMVIGSVYGVYDIGYKTTPDTSYVEIPVYSFGFNEPNTAFLTVFLMLMFLLYDNYEKLNIWWFLGTSGVAVLFYELTFCRTGIAVFCFAWGVIIYDKLMKKHWMKIVFALSVLVGTLFSFVTMVFYNGDIKIMGLLNHFVSGRIYIMNGYFLDQGLALLPRNQEFFYASYYGLIDNTYMYVLLYNGWIFALIFLAVICTAMFRMYRQGHYKELVMLSVFALYGVMEQFVLNGFMNPFILLMGILLYPDLLEKRELEHGKVPHFTNS